ncbi:MAG TPA: NRDE family protein [Geopsychrobacteraceae bacterium]|nr:NRDE family protein [Geopsychrobacteraceae bacterium]
MCLILLANHIHPDYPLVLAANRDEFHARPTRAAQWWGSQPNLLAGQDLTAGGTWLGITDSGRIAAITNYREPTTNIPTVQSRGKLTTEFLQHHISAEDYYQQLLSQRQCFNGYNLLFGSVDELHYFSNRGAGPANLLPSIYGVSNHLLDTPWPKVEKGKMALSEALAQPELDTETLWRLLSDSVIAPDSDLSDTGIGIEWERLLSAIKISGDHYGTRTSTLLLARRDGNIFFSERTLVPDTAATERTFSFTLPKKR